MQPARDNLKLSFGQVAWTICHGQDPDRITLDRLRYLRQLDVPFSEQESQGSGNRLTYAFHHLFECGFAIEAIRRGVKPMDTAKTIVSHRKSLRALARSALAEVDDEMFEEAEMAREIDGAFVLEDELFVGINDRYARKPWTYFEVRMGDTETVDPINVVQRLADGSMRELVPVKRLIVSWLVHARIAPQTKPGRR